MISRYVGKLTLLASLVSSTILVTSTPAQAIIPYLQLNNDQSISDVVVPEILGLGWEFSLSQPTRAEFLGIYDYQGNGVTSGLDIYLWNESNTTTPIAKVLNIDGLGGFFDNNFRWYRISPITLSPGSYVVSADIALPAAKGGTFTTLPQVTWIEGRMADLIQSGPGPQPLISPPVPALPYPAITTSGNGNWGGNVAYDDIPPAPGPLPLLGVSAAYGFSRKLRKRIKSSYTPEESPKRQG